MGADPAQPTAAAASTIAKNPHPGKRPLYPITVRVILKPPSVLISLELARSRSLQRNDPSSTLHSPFSHGFYHKCIRPLLEAHSSGFSCLLCRTFANLDKDVKVENEAENDEELEAALAIGALEGGVELLERKAGRR